MAVAVRDATCVRPQRACDLSPSRAEAANRFATVFNPSLRGYASFDGTTWTVQGGGADIWDGSDQFHFASTALGGDGQVTARAVGVTGTDP